MLKLKIAIGALSLGLILIYAGLITFGEKSAERIMVRGVVLDGETPVTGAVVRVQAADYFTLTDSQGRFKLSVSSAELDKRLTAWAPGYLIGWVEKISASDDNLITVTGHYITDNPDYDWFSHEGAAGSLSCSHCMPCYSEWQADAHSGSALNPRFLALYNGTTLTGRQGSPTVYQFDAELGIQVPAAGQNDSVPGYRLDFPDLGGNCANCHVPGAAARSGGAYHVDIQNISGIDLEGVFCEFCHKVGEVKLDPSTGLPNPALPGVLSMRLYRPDEGQQLFFGNFDDVTRRVTYLPLIEESAFCAPCHSGAFWDVPIYDSFGEWLASPYSNPETGKTCQDCHMPPVDYDYFVFPEQGGQIRTAERIFSHQMPGAASPSLLQETASLEILPVLQDNHLLLTVKVTNTDAGHHIPTDSPLRNMILLVSAVEAGGQTLTLLEGPTIPEWGGIGDPATGHYAGLPGVLYAKVLADFYTGEMPTYAYWRQTRLVSDNRLPALAVDESHYVFLLPSGSETITVDVQLILRRAYIELMELQHWNTPDIVMEHETVTVPR